MHARSKSMHVLKIHKSLSIGSAVRTVSCLNLGIGYSHKMLHYQFVVYKVVKMVMAGTLVDMPLVDIV